MLLPNLGQGKTEAVLTLSGPGSKRVRLDTFQGSTPTLAIPTELWQGARLRLVAGYKHLGGIISATGDLHVELRSRVGAAWQAYRKHRRKVFGSPIVSTRDKSILFSSLVESTLYYGVGSWPHVGARIVDKLQATLVSMARTMLRPTFDLESACHKSACYILSSARILSAASAVHVARLRHFQSVVRKASVDLWAILHSERSWLQQVKTSIGWMHEQLAFAGQAVATAQPWKWAVGVIQSGPTAWKRLVNRSRDTAMLRELWAAENQQFQGLTLRELLRAGGSVPAEIADSSDQSEICGLCNCIFSDLRAWSHHAFKCHGRSRLCVSLLPASSVLSASATTLATVGCATTFSTPSDVSGPF